MGTNSSFDVGKKLTTVLCLQVFRSIDAGSVKGFPTTVDQVQKEVQNAHAMTTRRIF